MKKLGLAVAALAILVLASCSSAGAQGTSPAQAPLEPSASLVAVATSPAPPPAASSASAQDAALAIKAKVGSATKVVALTETTDGNHLLGRPNGYSAASVIYDSGARCQGGPGASCGAMVEQWPTQADAQARSDYIQSVLKSAPVLGTEYDTVRGGLLLRVTGILPPSVAAGYKTAFEQ